MRPPFGLLALALVLFAPVPSQAQVHSHDHTSPYADFADREIKALAVEEIEGLLSGAGLGMALAGELNRYPGPRHVMEMAPMLGLTQEQETAVREIFEEMERNAQALGAEIVELERQLDAAFAQGTISEDRLESLVQAIATARGGLRVVHLRAHLQLRPVLTESQIARYQEARGYGG